MKEFWVGVRGVIFEFLFEEFRVSGFWIPVAGRAFRKKKHPVIVIGHGCRSTVLQGQHRQDPQAGDAANPRRSRSPRALNLSDSAPGKWGRLSVRRGSSSF